MQAIRRQALVLLTVLFFLLMTIVYISFNAENKSLMSLSFSSWKKEKSTDSIQYGSACANVNGDKLLEENPGWDRIEGKLFIMNEDDVITTDRVIREGESACIVVLFSRVLDKREIGPSDSILLQAIGENTTVTIDLQQHIPNRYLYLASVQFSQADTYKLKGSVEQRYYWWESPLYRLYYPYAMDFPHALIVEPAHLSLPDCNENSSMQGSWMKKTAFQSKYPLDFYGMFSPKQEDHAESGALYVPNTCRFHYTSIGQAARCLQDTTVHVWGDGNVRRNLKALSNSNRWCNEVTDPTNPCHCNDDNEDPTHTLYPWVTDPNTPLTFPEEWHSNGQFYYSTLDTLSSENWEQQIQQPSVTHPPADIVIVSAGNGDIALDSVTPAVFQTSFNAFLSAVVHKAYPHQKIVVRTPQYMGYGNISFTSWGGERSRVFANIIRDAVHMYNDRVVLWDVHQLAPLHTCWTQGTPYSKRGVIALENLLLFQLLCPIK